MKIKYILSAILFLYLGEAISQLDISDYNNCFIESINIEERSEDCGRLSEAYLTKYGNQSYNIPNSSNPQYKTILDYLLPRVFPYLTVDLPFLIR